MSPEQVRGETVDGRSDLLLARRACLYEALTGRKPFRAETIAALLNAILTVDPPPPSKVDRRAFPQSSRRRSSRAIARDRERRYRVASDLARELRAALGVVAPASRRGPDATEEAVGSSLRAAAILALVGAGGASLVAAMVPAGDRLRRDHVRSRRRRGGSSTARCWDERRTRFEVTEGTHEIEYRKEGYFPASGTTVPRERVMTVPIDLVPETEERPWDRRHAWFTLALLPAALPLPRGRAPKGDSVAGIRAGAHRRRQGVVGRGSATAASPSSCSLASTRSHRASSRPHSAGLARKHGKEEPHRDRHRGATARTSCGSSRRQQSVSFPLAPIRAGRRSAATAPTSSCRSPMSSRRAVRSPR